MNRRAHSRMQIGARMRRARLSVENPAMAKVRSTLAGDRNRERLIPKRLQSDLLKYGFGLLCFTKSARQIGFIELNVFVFDFQLSRRKFLRLNIDNGFTLFDRSILHREKGIGGMFARLRIEIDADDRR